MIFRTKETVAIFIGTCHFSTAKTKVLARPLGECQVAHFWFTIIVIKVPQVGKSLTQSWRCFIDDHIQFGVFVFCHSGLTQNAQSRR
jgi:hypothetical protein